MAEDFLSRWSKRKHEARAGAAPPAEPAPPAAPSAATEAAPAPAPGEPQPLPPVESLTPESDFTGFMRPEVDEAMKRRALKTLFRDPHFNVMDGLDVYIDDYAKPDPMPASWLDQLKQVERLGAYEEKVAPAQEGADVPGSADVLEGTEKPSVEQGFVRDPSTDTSDTPDTGISPPEVPE